MDDHWNVNADRELSDTWTRFTTFIVLKEKTPSGYTWSGESHKKTNDIQAWQIMARNVEMWKHMFDASKRKEKQKWKDLFRKGMN